MNKKILVVGAFIIILMIISSLVEKMTAGLSLREKGTKVEIASPVAGAKLYIDKDGPHSLPYTTNLPPGTYHLDIDAPGYASVEQSLTVSASDQPIVVKPAFVPESSTLSLFPLLTEPGAILAGGDGQHAYYAIGNQIREIKTYRMKTAFPADIEKGFWLPDGKGLFLAGSNWYIFTPPLKQEAVVVPGEPLGLLSDGRIYVRLQDKLGLYSIENESFADAGISPTGTIKKTALDPKNGYAVLSIQNGSSYAVLLHEFSKKSVVPLRENIPFLPSAAISGDGSFVAFTDTVGVETYIVSNRSFGPAYSMVSAGGSVVVAPAKKGFILMDPTVVRGSDEPTIEISGINPPDTQKVFHLYSIVVPGGLDVFFTPSYVPEYGLFLAEKDGPLWFLGDPVNLPPSVFERSLPPDIYKGH